MKKVELLSPVGNKEMLYQAIHNGADAVYLSGKSYGARKFADNFNDEEMLWAVNYAHLYGVLVYVTINTLIYENELESVLKYIEYLYKIGVDALIMQDIGLISIVRKCFPDLDIHASTQCHNHNKSGVSLLKKLGVTRVVFAREMTFNEIIDIDVDIEKEVFVYGALCVCYSGCCLFSSLNGGRSGNRGECVGSCRLPYRLVKNNTYVDDSFDYLLSMRELNTIHHVEELLKSGIDSFKIEGRMKSPAYVGYVTRLYRRLIDDYYSSKDLVVSLVEEDNLKKLFNRKFTSGFLFNDNNVANISTPNHQGLVIGTVIDVGKKIKIRLDNDNLSQNDGIRFLDSNEGFYINRLYDSNLLLVNEVKRGNICYIDKKCLVKKGELISKTVDYKLLNNLSNYFEKKIYIDMKLTCFIDSRLKLEVSDGVNLIVKYGNVVDKALKRDVSFDKMKELLGKLGNTPFAINSIDILKDDNIFVNLKDINMIRREALEELVKVRSCKKRELSSSFNVDKSLRREFCNNVLSLSVLVRNEEQLLCVLNCGAGAIYVTDYDLYLKYKEYKNVYYRLDRIKGDISKFNNENVLVTDLGGINGDSNNIVSDYYLNVTNHYTINYLRSNNVRRVTLSVEIDDDDIGDIMKYNLDTEIEVVIYGRLELMVMKYCPLKERLGYCNGCSKKRDKFYLEDKQGMRYPLAYEKCITHVMDCKKINKLDRLERYKRFGISYVRLEFFDESAKEIECLMEKVKESIYF